MSWSWSLKSNRADVQLIPSRNLSTILLVCSWLHFRKGLAEAETEKYWFVAKANHHQSINHTLRCAAALAGIVLLVPRETCLG